MNTIPLHIPDLSRHEESAVREALRHPSPSLLAAWENAWSTHWQRFAITFATAHEPLHLLKQLHGWPHGTKISLSPLLDPVWREALTSNWLEAYYCTQTPHPNSQALLAEHLYGVPSPAPTVAPPLLLEIISSMPLPLPGTGWGTVQLACLDGNRLLQASGTTVLLTSDPTLAHALRTLRQHAPSAVACALGLAQWERLPMILERRATHASHYLDLRFGTSFQQPYSGPRHWERYVLTAANPKLRTELEQYLRHAKILAASPIWHQTPQADTLTDVRHLLDCSLALPLYESLEPTDRKRIINRLRRWIDQWMKTNP